MERDGFEVKMSGKSQSLESLKDSGCDGTEQ